MSVIIEFLKTVPQTLLLGVFGIGAIVVIIVPITLRIAGLTGQQIIDLLTLTMQFFINLAREFKAQNKQG